MQLVTQSYAGIAQPGSESDETASQDAAADAGLEMPSRGPVHLCSKSGLTSAAVARPDVTFAALCRGPAAEMKAVLRATPSRSWTKPSSPPADRCGRLQHCLCALCDLLDRVLERPDLRLLGSKPLNPSMRCKLEGSRCSSDTAPQTSPVVGSTSSIHRDVVARPLQPRHGFKS